MQKWEGLAYHLNAKIGLWRTLFIRVSTLLLVCSEAQTPVMWELQLFTFSITLPVSVHEVTYL